MAVTGRPRLYQDHESFAAKVEDYFAFCEDNGKMPTLSGLCYFMGFHDKESFGTYADYGDDFSRTVKSTRLRMEDDRNQRLANAACTGVIFDLKNNWGWKDKTESEVTLIGHEEALDALKG